MTHALVARALEIALSHQGIREQGSNAGPAIESWLKLVGLGAGYPYCVAHIFACYHEAAKELGLKNPLPVTAKAVRLWQRSPEWTKSPRPTRGAIFVRAKNPNDRDSAGHAGIVVDVIWPESRMITIEANTGRDTVVGDPADRDGDGVHRRSRPIGYVNLGFLRYDREDETPKPGVG